MEGIRAAAGATAYEAMRARKSHLDGAGGLKWSPEVEDAVKALMSASERESVLVLMASDGERMNVGICPSDDSYPSPPFFFFSDRRHRGRDGCVEAGIEWPVS